jgi:hypothetical protein
MFASNSKLLEDAPLGTLESGRRAFKELNQTGVVIIAPVPGYQPNTTLINSKKQAFKDHVQQDPLSLKEPLDLLKPKHIRSHRQQIEALYEKNGKKGKPIVHDPMRIHNIFDTFVNGETLAPLGDRLIGMIGSFVKKEQLDPLISEAFLRALLVIQTMLEVSLLYLQLTLLTF